ncbi:MAG: DUF6069 family protein [bacterium]|nr:DUF6069 family protein [bacterium]
MQTKLTLGQSLKAGLFTAIAAALTNAIIFFIFKSIGIFTDSIFIDKDTNLTIVPVLISSILPTMIAAFVFFLFEKYSNKGYRNFSILSIVLVILSLFSPFSIPNVTLGFAFGLDLMHLVIVIYLLYFIKKAKTSNL